MSVHQFKNKAPSKQANNRYYRLEAANDSGGFEDVCAQLNILSPWDRQNRYTGLDIPLSDWAVVVKGSELDGAIFGMLPSLPRSRQRDCIREIMGSAVFACANGKQGVSYSRSRDHYTNVEGYPKRKFGYAVIVSSIAALEAAGLIKPTTAPPTPGGAGWRSWFALTELGMDLLRRLGTTGSIKLTLRGRSAGDWPPLCIKDRKTGRWIAYKDSPEALRINAQLQAINGFQKDILARLPADVLGGEHSPGLMRVLTANEDHALIPWPLDFTVRAIGLDDLDHGMRLYTGVSNLPRAAREQMQFWFRGRWENVIEIDVKSCHPSLLYELAGHAAPYDCYDIPGIDRATAKMVMTRLIGAGTWPAARGSIANELRSMHPDQAPETADDEAALLIDRVKAAHPFIAQYFRRDMGVKLQALEGRANIEIMQRCMETGIPALPLHDAVVVPERVAEVVEEFVREAFAEFCPKGGVRIEWKGRRTREEDGDHPYVGSKVLPRRQPFCRSTTRPPSAANTIVGCSELSIQPQPIKMGQCWDSRIYRIRGPDGQCWE